MGRFIRYPPKAEHAAKDGPSSPATLRMFGDAHNPTPTRSVTLPARSQARSDESEASKQPLVVPEIHPFTGTFAASEHTVAFGSKAFRSAFPLHVVALVFIFSNEMAIFVTSVTPRLTWPVIPSLVFPLLTLGARIAVHRLRCESSAQRLGAAAWTLLVAGESAVDIISSVVHPNDFCEGATVSYLYPMLAILFAVVNASHGMEFWHTPSLAGLVLCDFIAVRTVCAHPTSVNLAIVALVFTYGAGHFAQLLARHAFLRSERLEHDVHRLECLLTGPRGAQLPTVVVPTASGPLCNSLSASVPLSSVSRLNSQALLNAPAPSNPGPDPHPTPRTSHPPLALT